MQLQSPAPGASIMAANPAPVRPRCWSHGLPIEESMGYCWKCLAEERDPPDMGWGSWWWASAQSAYCKCRDPQIFSRHCLRCRLLMP